MTKIIKEGTKVKVFDFKTSIYLFNFKTQKYNDECKEIEKFKEKHEEALKVKNVERAKFYEGCISRTQAEMTKYEKELNSISSPEMIEEMINNFLINKKVISINTVSSIHKYGSNDTNEVHLTYTITYSEPM